MLAIPTPRRKTIETAKVIDDALAKGAKRVVVESGFWRAHVRLEALGIAPVFGSKNPFGFMER